MSDDIPQEQQLTTVEKVRLGCVPEHFSSPLHQALAKDLFGRHGFELEIVNCPGGTGEMVTKLKENELDIAIALTEGLISSLCKEDGPFRIIGTYVSSPLTWSIASSPTGRFGKVSRESPGPEAWEGLKGAKVGVSRLGSGSHLIPFVLADQMGWLKDGASAPFEFVPLKDIAGLVNGVKSGAIDTFLWERIMTKPHYDSGELHHLSNITPPWPAFMFAASKKALAHSAALIGILNVITESAKIFIAGKGTGDSVRYVSEKYHLPEDDVRVWFSSVAYPANCREVDRHVLTDCIKVLAKAGVVGNEALGIPLDRLVDEHVAVVTEEPLEQKIKRHDQQYEKECRELQAGKSE
ncbi:uncharacterized protein EV422DRAFT_532770 [Fimicolochytrium jonesii]|uniref:uncharacterized protein n=1 Tax=Fimicolochytrium jonesii TaxID=1396493 RepID=UPI0022FDE58E|nr:uncharacterized protein EV422DRAFT_532770 [Fimicolochytrium jonesii]KAI8819917.1 hypothetical protein EV422DRAFT_532770 [Fimicolochytrium jonesii]